ncbi:IclR family transcriptional regulator [Haloterrigena salina JCM 13891]|uniref:IclR family transcriptional regulator n=1 Tax=Haloterrigena salina JCM 13891 TaxID=1227488 RepID=M0BZL8_9EURY|nr:IclR family transcriptional regulator [Haloterrigena salina JCM 13891]
MSALSRRRIALGSFAVFEGVDARSRVDDAADVAQEKDTNSTSSSGYVRYDGCVIIYEAEGERAVSLDTFVGRRAPMHCTALGQAMLANMSRERVAEIIAEKGSPRSPRRRSPTENGSSDTSRRCGRTATRPFAASGCPNSVRLRFPSRRTVPCSVPWASAVRCPERATSGSKRNFPSAFSRPQTDHARFEVQRSDRYDIVVRSVPAPAFGGFRSPSGDSLPTTVRFHGRRKTRGRLERGPRVLTSTRSGAENEADRRLASTSITRVLL